MIRGKVNDATLPGRCRRRRGVCWGSPRFLSPILLLLLHRSDAHGYTLLERVKEFGLDDLNPTAVYRALREMEENGWVTSDWDTEATQGPPRRVYHLTAAGDAALAQWTADLRDTRQGIDRFLAAYQAHMRETGEHHG